MNSYVGNIAPWTFTWPYESLGRVLAPLVTLFTVCNCGTGDRVQLSACRILITAVLTATLLRRASSEQKWNESGGCFKVRIGRTSEDEVI